MKDKKFTAEEMGEHGENQLDSGNSEEEQSDVGLTSDDESDVEDIDVAEGDGDEDGQETVDHKNDEGEESEENEASGEDDGIDQEVEEADEQEDCDDEDEDEDINEDEDAGDENNDVSEEEDDQKECAIEGSSVEEDGTEDADETSNIGANLDLHKTKKGDGKPTTPGIVYLSRIPPFMSAKKLRLIFSQYGDIGRVFLQQDEKNSQKFKKKKKGKGKPKGFTEGWLEFKKKKIAKRVAITFNNTRVGNKKRSRYYDELWNMKYLPKFQWAHLMERLEYEQQVRHQRIRTEVMQTKKETNFYLQNVEQNKMIERMQTKKRKQGKDWDFMGRQFKQIKTEEEREQERRDFQRDMPQRAGKVTTNVLGKIFKK